MSDQQLLGRVAVVTGASRGIGKQIAIALAERGTATALVGRDAAALEEVRGSIASRGGGSELFVSDVSEESPVEHVRDRVTECLGPADILINNAGIILRTRMLEFSSEAWNRLIQTNLDWTVSLRACVRSGNDRETLRPDREYHLIFSHVGYLDRSAYCASKTGLLGLTRALALEFAPHGVTVNGVSPGPIATKVNTGQMLDSVKNAAFPARIPVGRWGKGGCLAAYGIIAEHKQCDKFASLRPWPKKLSSPAYCSRGARPGAAPRSRYSADSKESGRLPLPTRPHRPRRQELRRGRFQRSTAESGRRVDADSVTANSCTSWRSSRNAKYGASGPPRCARARRDDPRREQDLTLPQLLDSNGRGGAI